MGDPAGVLFRPAVADDLRAIVALLADDRLSAGRELVTAPPAPAYLAAWDAMAADPNQLPLVAERAGEVVGYLQLTVTPGLAYRGLTRATVESVRVASAERGRGIGAAFVAHAVGQARARGCAMVQLTSIAERAEAHRFYERLGFRRSHLGFKLWLEDA